VNAISGKVLFDYLNFEIDGFIRGYGKLEDLQNRANHSPEHIFSKIVTTFELRKP
jgi:hypothetical protein